MIDVDVERTVYSTVPGRTGNWSITSRVSLPAVPCCGDRVQMHEDGELCLVKSVAFLFGEPPVVTLEPVQTDDGRILDELNEFVSQHGWTQYGGPWSNQT